MDASIFVQLLVVLVLAGFVGYYVVSGVTPALHTPLMAVTNAISGIVVVAAMVLAGTELVNADLASYMGLENMDTTSLWVARVFGFLGCVLASMNVFGGFAMTVRMLEMFKPKAPVAKTEGK
ncbi:MAG: NAD(P) transhydrogenase subunit alpha [Alphaproteobacteria bacterium]